MALEIHPLVTTSVCDHFTRLSLGGSILPVDAPCIGLLFGTKDGDNLSVCDATEAVYRYVDGVVLLNHKFIQKKKQLWTAVYTNQQLIGWYCVGKEVTVAHIQLHQELLTFADSLLFLLMSPEIQISSNDLPLSLYDYENQQNIFIQRPFKLNSSTVEKISIDHVLKFSPSDGKSAVEKQNEALLTSIHTLVSRIDVVTNTLENMKSGTIPRNEEILRQIASITSHIPPNIYIPHTVIQQTQNELEDTLALSLVQMINTDMATLNELYACHQSISNHETQKYR